MKTKKIRKGGIVKKFGYLENSFELLELDKDYGWIETSVEEILEEFKDKLDKREVLKLLANIDVKDVYLDLTVLDNLKNHLEKLENYNYKEDLISILKKIGVAVEKLTEEDFETY